MAGLFFVVLLVCLFGVIRPFSKLTRKQWGLAAFGSFVLFAIAVPPAPEAAEKAAVVSPASIASQQPEKTAETQIAPDPASVETAASQDEEAIAQEAVSDGLTGPQRNAVRSAEQYLSMSGFSRQGLIEQLSSDAGEGYERADAEAAVDSLDVDWNENAARSARQYLDMTGFSCKGLIEQLSSSAGEDYTLEQATYGAQQAGAC